MYLHMRHMYQQAISTITLLGYDDRKAHGHTKTNRKITEHSQGKK
jgi:hypothetical protein